MVSLPADNANPSMSNLQENISLSIQLIHNFVREQTSQCTKLKHIIPFLQCINNNFTFHIYLSRINNHITLLGYLEQTTH